MQARGQHAHLLSTHVNVVNRASPTTYTTLSFEYGLDDGTFQAKIRVFTEASSTPNPTQT